MRRSREAAWLPVRPVSWSWSSGPSDQPWPFPTSLMVGFTATAISTELSLQESEIVEARWFTREELRTSVESGEVGLPTTISIAGALITRWYGAELPPNVLEL